LIDHKLAIDQPKTARNQSPIRNNDQAEPKTSQNAATETDRTSQQKEIGNEKKPETNSDK